MTVNVQAPFPVDGYFRKLIDEKVEKLSTFYDGATTISFFMKEDEHRHLNSNGKTVEIQCNVPGTELFSSGSAESFEVALADAYEKMRRQIKKYKEKK
jgi:ribosomal subunit interface protein